MFAIGCIQSMSCHTNRCPTGVATQDVSRQRALVVPDKAERVHQFHDRTVAALADMLAAAGLSHPDQLMPHHIVHRVSQTEIRQFDQVHHFIGAGSLTDETCALPYYNSNWRRAQAVSFAAIGG
jgi:Conserved region in glutamate synthase